MAEPNNIVVRPVEGSDERIAWRELDLVAAEAELRLRLPNLRTALDGLDKAKIITQETLECEFSI